MVCFWDEKTPLTINFVQFLHMLAVSEFLIYCEKIDNCILFDIGIQNRYIADSR